MLLLTTFIACTRGKGANLVLFVCISVELNHQDVPSEAVFTNSEISLKHIDVYGFDFDYTLLQYTPELHRLIYTAACKRLVDKLSVRLHNRYAHSYCTD